MHSANLLKIRLAWVSLLALIFFFLIWQFLSPGGSWTCRRDFSQNSASFLSGRSCLGEASPAERVVLGRGGPLLMLADPLYFSVFSPRAFSHAEVEIIYRPHFSSSTPVFEAGFLADADLWRYRLRPVYNLWLEKSFRSWPVKTQDNWRLFQRQEKFTDVAEFLQTWQGDNNNICVFKNCLALYNIDSSSFPPTLDLNSFGQKIGGTSLPFGLRGTHQFYFYLSGGDLDITGSLLDGNENKDRDDAEFFLFYGKELISSLRLPDDRTQIEESGVLSAEQNFQIIRSNLKSGIYRLEFRANDDLTWNNLRINSAYLSFIHRIWPISEFSLNLITDASYLQVKALDPAALQTINFGGQSLNISSIYKQYEALADVGGQTINLSRGSIILENNGVFALSADALLNPDYPRLDRFAPSVEQLDFVLADYEPAVILDNGWLRSRLDFASGDLYREKGRYNLILSVPGLQLDRAEGLLEIKEIKVHFYGKNLMEKIKDWFNL
jgi:hypothetical protein